MSLFVKDPAAVLDYQVSWASWVSDGEQITSSSWTVQTGITKDSDTSTATTATVWLSGGTLGQSYTATNQITTNQGRTDERTIQIVVRDR